MASFLFLYLFLFSEIEDTGMIKYFLKNTQQIINFVKKNILLPNLYIFIWQN